MEELKHADFSPSKFEQYRVCPGSYQMQLGLPEQEGIFAKEGHLLHCAVMTGNYDGMSDEQIAAVESCRKLLNKLTENRDCGVFFEEKIQIKAEDGSVITYGFADVIIDYRDSDELIVIDWKFGYNKVKDAGRNLQIAGYCLGAMQRFDKPACRAIIHQPRIRYTTDYTFSNKTAILANYQNIILQCKSSTIVLNADEDACRYCKARLNCRCPAFRVKFQHLAAGGAGVDLSNAETVEKLYDTYKSMKPFFAEIEDALHKIIEQYGKCGKYILQVTEGKREIKDVTTAQEQLADIITNKEFTSLCTVSVTKLTSMLAERIMAEKGIKKTEAKAEAEKLLLDKDLIKRGNPVTKITVA